MVSAEHFMADYKKAQKIIAESVNSLIQDNIPVSIIMPILLAIVTSHANETMNDEDKDFLIKKFHDVLKQDSSHIN